MTVSTEGVFSKMGNMLQGKVHTLLDGIENKAEALENEIRKAKRELGEADKGERELRKQIILVNGKIEVAKEIISAAKEKATAVLQKGKADDSKMEEAKSIANDIMAEVNPQTSEIELLTKQRDAFQENLDQMLAQLAEYREYIPMLENELTSLRTRIETGEALKKIQAQTGPNINGDGLKGRMERLRETAADIDADLQAGSQMTKERSGGNAVNKRADAFLDEPAGPQMSEADKLLAEMGMDEKK